MNLRTVQPQSKYGLVKKSNSNLNKQRRPVGNIPFFGNDEDEDDEEINVGKSNVNKLLSRNGEKKDSATEKLHAAALAEDDNIFNYDDAYDSFKSQSVQSHPLSSGSAPVGIFDIPLSTSFFLELCTFSMYMNRKLATSKV